jgi:hypothetical protein
MNFREHDLVTRAQAPLTLALRITPSAHSSQDGTH